MTQSSMTLTQAPPTSRFTVEHHDGRSALTSVRNIAPLKILNPRTHSPACYAMLSSYGGGLLQGDTVELELEAGSNSRLFLGSQAHGHVYRSPDGRASTWSLTGSLAAGALVVAYLDPLIPHAESRYRQLQHWQLDPTAELVLVEWISAGRVKTGEVFAFESVETQLELRAGDELIALERTRVEPGLHAPASALHFGDFRQWMNIYLAGPRTAELAALFTPQAIRADASDADSPLEFLCSTHPLRGTGFQVRAIAREREPLQHLIDRLFARLAAPAWLGFNPLRHKQ